MSVLAVLEGTHVCACKEQQSVSGRSLGIAYFTFWDGIFHWFRHHKQATLAGQQASWIFLALPTQVPWLQTCATMLGSFTWVIGIELRFSYLQSKHFIDWAVLPPPKSFYSWFSVLAWVDSVTNTLRFFNANWVAFYLFGWLHHWKKTSLSPVLEDHTDCVVRMLCIQECTICLLL